MTTYARSQQNVRASEIETYEPAAQISLTVSGGATPSDTSNFINVRGAKAIEVTMDHKRGVGGADSASTSITLTVYTSPDGSKVDTEAYASMNLGAAKIKTIPVTPGMDYIQVGIVNGDAANATKVLPTVKVTY